LRFHNVFWNVFRLKEKIVFIISPLVIKLECTAKSKQASIEWRKKGEVAPVKVKIHHSAVKVSSKQFFGTLKVFCYFLYERHTVNAVYYYQVLDKARLSYRSKRRGFPIRSVLLQEHNA